jgi:hypothetical protein
VLGDVGRDDLLERERFSLAPLHGAAQQLEGFGNGALGFCRRVLLALALACRRLGYQLAVASAIT